MAPFQYSPYHNPYAIPISELIARGGDIQAQGVRDAGAAMARGQELSGQVVGNAIQNVGGDVARIALSYPASQRAAQESKLTALKVADIERQQQGERRLASYMQGDQLAPGDVGPRQESYLTEDGLWDVPKLSAALASSVMGDQAASLLNGAEKINASILDAKKGAEALRVKHAILLGDTAYGTLQQVKLGADLMDAMDRAVQPAIASRLIDPQQYAQVRSQIEALPPAQREAALTMYMDQAAKLAPEETLGKDVQKRDRYGRLIASNIVPEKPTEASIAYDLSSPDPTVRARAQTAMNALKPDQVKPGTVEDWVRQSRTLAGWDKKSPLEQQQIDAAAIRSYKELSKEPGAAELAQSNAELRNVLLKMQVDQQPTHEDAKGFAQQIIDHQLAPSQIQLFGGFGTAGAAFKRMIAEEALKLDPQFNWQQAESDYQFSKNPTFQNTIRFMDSALESLPRLQKNFAKLANGGVTSINSLVNQGKKQFQDVDLNAAQKDAIFVGDEIAKILQGGGTGSGISDAKLKQAQDVFSSSDNPAVINSTINEINALLGYRRNALTRGTYRALPQSSPQSQSQGNQGDTQGNKGLPPGATVRRY